MGENMRFKITSNEGLASSRSKCTLLAKSLIQVGSHMLQCAMSAFPRSASFEGRTHLCTVSSSVRDASLLLPRSGSAEGSSISSSSSSWAKEPASVVQTRQTHHILLCRAQTAHCHFAEWWAFLLQAFNGSCCVAGADLRRIGCPVGL